MEGIVLSELKIRSNFGEYAVEFTENAGLTYQHTVEKNDTLIVDRKILGTYPDVFPGGLPEERVIAIDADENQKSYEGIIPIIGRLIETGYRKNNRLIAAGGGITQDVTAFISSILYRGTTWLFFPTTLLAQADSCIGSKTSINFRAFKNQIGGFHPPTRIFIDLRFLKTLSDADWRSGLGEMSHYFVIAGREEFLWFKNAYPDAKKNPDVLQEMISRSLAIKKQMIEIDEFDRNERQIFNYGHSFGHAIESLTDYAVPHGIAVSYGMDMANFISVRMGYIDEEIRREIRSLLRKIWDGYSLKGISLERFRSALAKDKKNVGTELRLILNHGYGKIRKEAVSMDERFLSWIHEYFENETTWSEE
jgi:3-dehydroquinate synthase